MPDFQPVRPGDKFQPTAFEYNAMLEAGQAHRRGVGAAGGPAEGFNLQPVVVRVKNTSGAGRNRYTVLSMGAARWALDANQNIEGVVFAAGAYDADAWPVVLQQPLAANAIGVGVCTGPTLVQVGSGGSSGELYGTPSASYDLTPGSSGPVFIPGGTASAGIKLGIIGGGVSQGIIDIRLSGNNLQYTFNGTDWTTWHTATEC